VSLAAFLSIVEDRVRGAVAARRAGDPRPDDPFRGLYLSDDDVDRILDIPTAATDSSSRLDELAAAFELDPLDMDFLMLALAPELDVRFEALYGYLNDDVTQRRPTVRLALELHGLPAVGPWRFRLAPGSPLVDGGLLEIREPDRPSLSRVLHVPDRVVGYLLGHDEPDARLSGIAAVEHALPETDIAAGIPFVYLRAGWAGAAASALAGRPALTVDARALSVHQEPEQLLAVLLREARLRGAGIALGPVEALEPDEPRHGSLLRAVAALAHHVPLVVYGRRAWDPLWAKDFPLTVTVTPDDAAARAVRWLDAVGDQELADALSVYRLGPDQIAATVRLAGQQARAAGRPVNLADLRAGALSHNGTGLERLARRITPAVGWADLVTPEPTRRGLADVVARARHRDTVLGHWRMRPGGGRGRGVTALFAGESGTGKTLAAEVIAAELGMDLYVVDLSTVVDKYVGETEKNLDRIFTEAARVNGVLLFDEADAIFGKRSAVRDAHDRYANIESAFLLQRMESFDGIAVLTTNLRANLDDAFTRRLDVVADFPLPDEVQRLALWDRCLGTALPRAADVDLDRCAERFELAGGSIRSCAVTAAYLAAAEGRPVTMADLVTAVYQEYRKLGRLVRAEEFGGLLGP
jgi:Winged helix domain, variant/ATPase family associated with various cellular activities (AAA)